jgi:hypothetical protein
MLIPTPDTECRVGIQPGLLVGDSSTTELLPRLSTRPGGVSSGSQSLSAGMRHCDLTRPAAGGLVAYALRSLSTRCLGAWTVLMELTDISEAAWRKLLWSNHDCLVWLLGGLIAGTETPAPVDGNCRG